MPESSDEQLMLNYGKGDMASFESLYRRHHGPLFRYLLHGCSNHSTAEELFQDVWSGIIKARERYKADASFKTYLYRLAHNRLVDYYRQSRLRLVEAQDTQETIADRINTENFVNDLNCVERLKQELAQLPNEQRDAFILKEETEMSIEQIGEVVGSGRETIKSRLRYALKRLRETLEDCL